MKTESRITSHKLPICRTTGLDRYRERHQARQGAAALRTTNPHIKWATFACPECHGFHLEKLPQRNLRVIEPAAIDAAPLPSGPRRYVLVDIENLVAGHATRGEAMSLWRVLAQMAPGITPNDHILIGGNRHVARKLSTTIAGSNIKWVVGALGPDGADRALLAATNVHQIAKKYDELVIMSGDHAFTELALHAKRLGLRVHVVATKRSRNESSLSRQLAAAADLRTIVPLHTSRPRATQTNQTSAA